MNEIDEANQDVNEYWRVLSTIEWLGLKDQCKVSLQLRYYLIKYNYNKEVIKWEERKLEII